MATPLTAQRFELLARRAGLAVRQHDGWMTRNRGGRGDGWGITDRNPTGVHGVMVHHTVTRDLDGTVRLIIKGRPDLPGPLYSGLVDEAGVLHMVGWGRCNHAGLGDDLVLRAVVREDAKLPSVPPGKEATVDGNARFYGFAFLNLGNGIDTYPAVQLATMAKACAVICRHHVWTHRSVIGHKDWQRGKIDPHGPQGYLMPGIRGRVAAELRKKG